MGISLTVRPIKYFVAEPIFLTCLHSDGIGCLGEYFFIAIAAIWTMLPQSTDWAKVSSIYFASAFLRFSISLQFSLYQLLYLLEKSSSLISWVQENTNGTASLSNVWYSSIPLKRSLTALSVFDKYSLAESRPGTSVVHAGKGPTSTISLNTP